MEEKTENSPENGKKNVSREIFEKTDQTDVNLYKQTNQEKVQDIKQDSEIYMFTDEDRARGNEKAAETNREKGRITELLENIDKDYKELAAIVERSEKFKNLGQQLYVFSRWMQNKRRLTDALIDLAAGVCIGVMPDKEDPEKKIRVYTEKPSIMAFKYLREYQGLEIPPDEKKSRKKTGKSKDEKDFDFENI